MIIIIIFFRSKFFLIDSYDKRGEEEKIFKEKRKDEKIINLILFIKDGNDKMKEFLFCLD